MICSTINRNPKSFAMAIVGAEYVMRWLPKGTHEWSKFITPDELYALISGAGLDAGRPQGLRLQSRSPGAGDLRPRSFGELRHRLDQAGLTLRHRRLPAARASRG
jgi:hypothetical protein